MQHSPLVPIVGCALVCFLFLVGAFSNIEVKITDNLHGGIQPQNILIVAIDDPSLQELGRWPWPRNLTAKLITQLEEARVTGVDIGFYEPSNQDHELAEAISNAHVVLAQEHSQDQLLQATPLIGANANHGYVNVITDRDKVTRAIKTDLGIPFSVEILRQAGYQAYPPERMLINFVGPPQSFEYVSAKDLLSKKINVKDRIVLVGATSPGLHDDYLVPTSEGKAMPGVEVHANAIQTMLQANYLYPLSRPSTLAGIIVLTGIATAITWYFSYWVAAVLVALLILILPWLTILTFEQGTVLPVLYFELSVIVSTVMNTAHLYFVEGKKRREIQQAFGKYVSKDLVNDLVSSPEKLKLGGERKEITVFFSDIRGFTSVSEALSPEDLVHLLNEYLDSMTSIVLKNKGCVDKFMGDAIMAFWNAPVDEAQHAELACETSLEMMEELARLQKKWTKEGVPALDIGIGLNTGDAIVGNMGSHERFDYTAMGDTINLGSRLEGLNKQYGTHIIISQHTNKHVKHKYLTRPLDFVKVKGKKEAIEIFELIAEKAKCKNKQPFVKEFEKALDYYKAQQWDAAIKGFQKALHLQKDTTAETMIERCKVFKKNPPGKDWDGSWEMKSK